MRRYQDLIDGPLSRDISKLGSALRSKVTIENLDKVFKDLSILNMLNTKYIIYNSDANPLINTSAMGNAWFVKEVKWVKNADGRWRQ